MVPWLQASEWELDVSCKMVRMGGRVAENAQSNPRSAWMPRSGLECQCGIQAGVAAYKLPCARSHRLHHIQAAPGLGTTQPTTWHPFIVCCLFYFFLSVSQPICLPLSHTMCGSMDKTLDKTLLGQVVACRALRFSWGQGLCYRVRCWLKDDTQHGVLGIHFCVSSITR